MERGSYATAAEAFQDAERLYREQYGRTHKWVSQAIAHRAFCYVRLGRVDEGVSLYEEALELERQSQGSNTARARELMNELVRQYQAAGKHDAANRLIDQLEHGL
jgi:tetratricopeptide (TPR) repeat protein